MSWPEINLLIYIAASSVGAMNLCLAWLFHVRNDYEWTRYYLVFQITMTLLLTIYALRMYTTTIIGHSWPVFDMITSWILYVGIAFLIYFIPYFTTWVISHPWRNPYKTIFTVASALFLGMTIYGTAFEFFPWLKALMVLLFFGGFGFCIGVILKNIRGIDDRNARLICGAFVILSAFMMPFMIVDLFFSFGGLSTLPIYYFWSSLIVLVYLFVYFLNIGKEQSSSIDESKAQQYHITEREKEIIELIGKGRTSKEISSDLGISTSTVNNHISNIYSKTNATSRIDLINLLYR